MSEKRNFTRVDFAIHATVTSELGTASGEVDNISLRGVFIRSVKIPVSTPTTITIQLDAGEPDVIIRTEASAVRCGEEGTAFEFTKIDIDSFTHLRKIVSYAISDGDAVMTEFATYIDHKLHEEQLEKE